MNKLKNLLFVVVAALAGVIASQAQTTTTITTLSAAVTSESANAVVVASATGITAGTTGLFVDHEFLLVTAVNGTRISVVRGANSTAGALHASGAAVVVGPLSNGPFVASDKIHGTPCTATSETYLPQFNPITGNQFECTGSVWTQVGHPAGLYATITFCGDQPNNTTNYDSPIDGFPGGNFYAGTLTANDLGFTLAGTGCDAEDSTTEATADEPILANNALHVLGLSCTSGNAGSNGTTVNMRSAAASLTPDVTLTIPTTLTTGATAMRSLTKVAAGATLAIRQIATEDLSATNVWCQARVQVLP